MKTNTTLKKGLALLFLLAGPGFHYSVGATDSAAAQRYYQQRGENAENAKKAADLYQELAQQENDPTAKAILNIQASQAIYFYASNQEAKEDRKRLHEKGFQVADTAVVALTGGDSYSDTPLDPAQSSNLARAHYFSAINMGKWAQARGILASLDQWKHMKKHLDAILKNDETVEDYGVYRTYGRSYMKLPKTHDGSKEKSEESLKTAYDNTLHSDLETSTCTTTTLYYLDILAKRDNADVFCEVYDGLNTLREASPEELKGLNPNRVPENQRNLQQYEAGAEKYMKKIEEYGQTNC